MTKREIDVLRCVAKGMPNKLIAKELHLSIYTVKNHVHNILEKTGLRTRDEAAVNVLKINEPMRPNPCSCCPVQKTQKTRERLNLIAADLRRIATELEGD